MKTIAERLFSLLQIILRDNKTIPGMYHPIIINMVKPYLRETSESDLRTMILYVRDQVIPFILGETDESPEAFLK